MADWTLGTDAEEHLVEHNLFDHTGIATPTAGKVLGVSGGKYTQIDAGTGDHDALTNVSANDHHAENHQARHQVGSADPLSGSVDANARVAIAKNGSLVGTRRRVNLIEGANVTLTVADDSGSEEVDVTIASSATGGGGGLEVSHLSVNTSLTASGIYIVNTSGGNRTMTLPALSGTPSGGYRFQIIREGANLVYVVRAGSDLYWDGTTQKTIFDNYGAVSIVAGPSSTAWLELGRYRTVT